MGYTLNHNQSFLTLKYTVLIKKTSDVITKFSLTVLTSETLSQFATKLCVRRIHSFLKKQGDNIIMT